MNPNLRNCEIVKVINLAVSELVVNWQRFLLDTDISVTALPRILEIWHCIVLSMNSLQKILELFFFSQFPVLPKLLLSCYPRTAGESRVVSRTFTGYNVIILFFFKLYQQNGNKMSSNVIQTF